MTSERSGGQSLLEFALTLPVFLWLLVGLLDLGRGVASYTVLANSAREGARAAIIPFTSDATIEVAVNSQGALLGTIPAGDISVSPPVGSRSPGTQITVEVRWTFRPFTPFVSNAVGSAIQMSATSVATIE
ncbi:MAG: TadE/TadG family type IV pilus assembly protein [Sphingomonadaceae bacterium]